jgi:signal transduction histidine kinase
VANDHFQVNHVFDEAEDMEFRQQNYPGAAAMLRQLVHSSDPEVRAGALLRAARNLHNAGNDKEALGLYDQLADMGPTALGDGMLADLTGRYRRLSLLLATGQKSVCEREASGLYADLQGGKWQISRDQWAFYMSEVGGCYRPDSQTEANTREAAARATGVERLWKEWQDLQAGAGHPRGRLALEVADQPIIIVWRKNPEGMSGVVAGKRYLESDWARSLDAIGSDYRFVVRDAEGNAILGSSSQDARSRISRVLSDAQLPWTLTAEIADPGAEVWRLAARRRWLLAGLFLAGALLVTAGVFVARAIARELEVARLQSDFVSTVSHEFRTPLASLRQATELLLDGRVSTEQRRQSYYEALRSETERLQRLVEDLLDFRRMEAGAQQYHFEPLSVTALVRTVTDEFFGRMQYKECQIEVISRGPLPDISAEPYALGRALWNLLDNAVKYSMDRKIITVETESDGNSVAIHVRDQGIGIAHTDQKKIFKKFVRSGAVRAAGIKGTGLGLAIAHQIVAAHGGRILVKSQLGLGSTFTIALPAMRMGNTEPARKQVAT